MSYQPEGDENERRLMQAAQSIGRTLLSPGDTKREATRLLVEGWKMLGQTCPITEYPLFYNKKTGETWSVRLQMPVKLSTTEESEIVKIETVETTNKKLDEPLYESNTFEELSQSNSTKSTRDISKIIGEKLLLGWEMLNDHVDGCPILVDPANGRKWLPATQDYLSDETSVKESSTLNDNSIHINSPAKNGVLIDVEEEEPLKHQSFETSGAPLSIETRDDSEISVRIAEKLLFGWEMLNESCPITNSCPLMRDPKTGRKYSAALDRFIDSANGSSNSDNKKAVEKTPVAPAPQATLTASVATKVDQISQSFSDSNLKSVLELKLGMWTNDLKKENDLEICKKLLELIQQAMVIRESIV